MTVERIDDVSLEDEIRLRTCMTRMWGLALRQGHSTSQVIDETFVFQLSDGMSWVFTSGEAKVWFPVVRMRTARTRTVYSRHKMFVATPDAIIEIFASGTQFTVGLRLPGARAMPYASGRTRAYRL